METIKELKKICQFDKTTRPSPSDFGYLQHRKLSIYITKVVLALANDKIKPNHISVFNIVFGAAILVLIAFNFLPLYLLLILFYFSFLLDKVDGEVARYKKLITLKGLYLDEVYHLFIQNGLILAIGANLFLVTDQRIFLFLGLAGFLVLFLTRYIRKLKYFIYAKRKSNEGKFLTKKELDGFEKLFAGLLNILPLKLCSVSRRHDIFLFLVFLFSIFYSGQPAPWLWLLSFWLAILTVYTLRFLFLNYFFIDRDIQLIEEDKL